MASMMLKNESGLHLWAFMALLLLWGGGGGGPAGVDAGKVLGIFYFPGRSHFVIFEPLLKELARRGHQVDVVSHFPQKTPLPNYTDISLEGTTAGMANSFTFEDLLDMHFFKLMYFTWILNYEMCEKAMEHPDMKKLAQTNERYDVVLVEIFGVDCAYGYAYKIGAPVIGLTSLVGLPYGQERVGNPDNSAYIPVANLPFSSHMSFTERVLNTLGQLYAVWGEKLRGRRPTDELLRDHFGSDIPPLSELVRNTSLVMVNSHFSLNGARPTVPGYVEVGGMHVDPKPGKLPKNMQTFLDDAGPEGAVLVSFGSLLRAEMMPPEKLQAFVRVLGAVPQRVIWRIDGSKVPGGLPRNVMGSSWIPQQEILSHPKMRAFVSHGGLGSTQEALHWGVPAVVVPFFTDQRQNGKLWQERGAARVLQFADVTAETLGEALAAVLDDPSYLKNAKKLSAEFRDRPITPMETAVYWTEYVMRHRGAPQLRSAALDLAWYQLWLLDVAAALAALVAFLAAILWLVARAVCRCVCPRGNAKTKTKTKTS